MSSESLTKRSRSAKRGQIAILVLHFDKIMLIKGKNRHKITKIAKLNE